jgi:phosphatidate cytidylyltransferase
MVKHRLIFGTIMTVSFACVVLLDGWLDGSLFEAVPEAGIQGTLVALLVGSVIVASQLELATLAEKTGAKIFKLITLPGVVIMSSGWYLLQMLPGRREPQFVCLLFSVTFLAVAILAYQAVVYGTTGVMANCGANFFSLVYIGVLSSFILAIRIEYGPLSFLMFVFAVKSADIGAYAVGTFFGRHRFAPSISPAKTWEGLAGAVLLGSVVSSMFACFCGIMQVWLAVCFGAGFALVGQAGDLFESMIKRNAGQKDSGDKIPGFGGILDLVDSPLVAAPFAYLFFAVTRAG